VPETVAFRQKKTSEENDRQEKPGAKGEICATDEFFFVFSRKRGFLLTEPRPTRRKGKTRQAGGERSAEASRRNKNHTHGRADGGQIGTWGVSG